MRANGKFEQEPLYAHLEVTHCETCSTKTTRPYAMERGRKVFCQRSCWESWKEKQARVPQDWEVD